ncbi:MAG: hypothetical protein AAGJ32_08030 [Pseudomonadota bacterium]
MRSSISSFAILAAASSLTACSHAPEPLGAATAANIERQTVTPREGDPPRGAIDGGQGGRAGQPVKALAERQPGDRS